MEGIDLGLQIRLYHNISLGENGRHEQRSFGEKSIKSKNNKTKCEVSKKESFVFQHQATQTILAVVGWSENQTRTNLV